MFISDIWKCISDINNLSRIGTFTCKNCNLTSDKLIIDINTWFWMAAYGEI